ncbi:acetate--CoA ligase [Oceanobacillus sp. CAU 1775]
MDMKTISVREGSYNLQDYDQFRRHFSWDQVNQAFSWHVTGKVNVAYEALDRHAMNPDTRDKLALIYATPEREESYTYSELSKSSNRFANVLRKYGVEKGENVFILSPKTPDYYNVFFGVLKTGAVAAPLSAAFMEQAIRDRLEDSEASILVTTKELLNRVPYEKLPALKKIIVIGEAPKEALFINYEEELAIASEEFEMEWVDLEAGMMLHYTSGSTGKPKGVYHVHQAMIQQYATSEWVLDLKEDDIYWCTADPGWITGTSYGILGPFMHGVTTFINDGTFTPKQFYQVIEKYQLTVWYTSPNILRILMSQGEESIKNYNLSSLRHMLSIGEALSPETVSWVLNNFNLRIHDTWWMTETGAQIIVNLPCNEIRPGSMGKPIPGVEAAIIDNEGNKLPPNQMGTLAIKKGWPAMMRQILNNPWEYESYFLDDWYLSGDSAYYDEDGYFWFQGRLDDVINASGERIGPFEIESKLVEHPAVAEAGVIGKPDPVHGEIIKAFIILNENHEKSVALQDEIRDFITAELSTHATPDEIEIVDTIPKTRSGKIMRRLLKSWELDLPEGDISGMDR